MRTGVVRKLVTLVFIRRFNFFNTFCFLKKLSIQRNQRVTKRFREVDDGLNVFFFYYFLNFLNQWDVSIQEEFFSNLCYFAAKIKSFSLNVDYIEFHLRGRSAEIFRSNCCPVGRAYQIVNIFSCFPPIIEEFVDLLCDCVFITGAAVSQQNQRIFDMHHSAKMVAALYMISKLFSNFDYGFKFLGFALSRLFFHVEKQRPKLRYTNPQRDPPCKPAAQCASPSLQICPATSRGANKNSCDQNCKEHHSFSKIVGSKFSGHPLTPYFNSNLPSFGMFGKRRVA